MNSFKFKKNSFKVKAIPCEVYSRVVGYFRPVSNWNSGKQIEFAERKTVNLKKMFMILSFSFFLFSCSATWQKPQVVQKPLLLKCQVPEVPKADLQPIPENATYPEKLQIILNNCLKIQKENDLLRSALEVCK